MKIIAETKRLTLRELTVEDAADFYRLNESLEVLKYTGDSPFASLREAESFLENYSDYEQNGFGRWAVLEKDSGRFLGWCGLKINEENQVDLGFRFFEEYWGKGYATEAARACLKVGFERFNLEEIIGRANKENTASIRVLEKIGMHFWKVAEAHGIDCAFYYRLNQESWSHLKRSPSL
ncbi:GNAT family N-acetyltransferase [Cryomorphaceae bacterium 1068]|nr:GNAT family N-acetyltransferase [Cryomorphaceae bacterium 1068]